MTQTLILNVVERPDAPCLKLTCSLDADSLTGEIPPRWTLATDALARIRGDIYLTTIDIRSDKCLETEVDAYWTMILRHIAPEGRLPALRSSCDVVALNGKAGSLVLRDPGAYDAMYDGDRAVSHGERIPEPRPVRAVRPQTYALPTGSALSRSEDKSRVSDAGFLVPLTSFYDDSEATLPWSPILLVQYKKAQPAVSADIAFSNMKQLSVVMEKASLHRQCPYGLLCIADRFTRVTVHPNNRIEIDVLAKGVLHLRNILGLALSEESLHCITWTQFMRHADVLQTNYPILSFYSGRRGGEKRNMEANVQSLVELVQSATDSAHRSMANNQDLIVARLSPVRGGVRLIITDVEPLNVVASLISRTASLIPSNARSGASGSTTASGPGQPPKRTRAEAGLDQDSLEVQGNMDDPDVPSIPEDSSTALNLLVARDQKRVPAAMAHELQEMEEDDFQQERHLFV